MLLATEFEDSGKPSEPLVKIDNEEDLKSLLRMILDSDDTSFSELHEELEQLELDKLDKSDNEPTRDVLESVPAIDPEIELDKDSVTKVFDAVSNELDETVLEKELGTETETLDDSTAEDELDEAETDIRDEKLEVKLDERILDHEELVEELKALLDPQLDKELLETESEYAGKPVDELLVKTDDDDDVGMLELDDERYVKRIEESDDDAADELIELIELV